MNIALSEKLIHQLVHLYSVRTFCLCPGGRNAPLVSVLAQSKGLEILSFFDERSAGFFALGRIRRDQRPVVVLTTSGSAVAELLPSVIEAWYSSLPVVLLTADRPSSYRLTGAPQSMEQKEIFGPYVGRAYDLENSLDFDLSDWDGTSPCHINVCFDEPLVDGEVPALHFRDQNNNKPDPGPKDKQRAGAMAGTGPVDKKGTGKVLPNHFPSPQEMEKSLNSFFKKVKKPLCLLAEMPEKFQSETENILSYFGFPVYAEALSGLRESKKLFILRSGEGILKWMVQNKKVDGVLRLGRRPVARFWQDLEKLNQPGTRQAEPAPRGLPFEKSAVFGLFSSHKANVKHAFSNKISINPHLPVLSVSDQSYSGLSRAGPALSFEAFFEWAGRNRQKTQAKKALKFEISNKISIAEEDKKHHVRLLDLLDKYPLSEPALIRDFSQKIPEGSLLFLGNSLPIREWNGTAGFEKTLKYMGNRGINGIDGQLSTFLGACEHNRSNWCLTGDLSALYDLSSLWAFRQLREKPSCFIVVVNNSGGRIFSSLFADPLFINEHNLSFQKWAEMWHFHYYFLTRWPDKLSFRSPAIIELKVDPAHTVQFWRSAKKEIV